MLTALLEYLNLLAKVAESGLANAGLLAPALLQGVGMSAIRVVLHAIDLQSDVVSGTVVVGL